MNYCKNNRGETLVSILVGMFIIALIVWSIARLIAIQYTVEDEYVRNQVLYLLQNNTSNIVRKLDTTTLSENELFSVYKDVTNKRFVVMTGASMDPYKYIDRRGEWISNTGSYQWIVYTRLLFVDKNDTSPVRRQVVKAEVRELIRSQ